MPIEIIVLTPFLFSPSNVQRLVTLQLDYLDLTECGDRFLKRLMMLEGRLKSSMKM